ncbi:hypothetical protein FRB90_009630 [Tulasnella sp. 427]|nr:hypothetical protein FRB90_009630 [Tulasnella sp. 427]
MTALPDPKSIRERYLTDPKWTSIHILPDSLYNQAHDPKRYVLTCPCKDTLRDAFVRLRLLKVTTLKSIDRKKWESLLQSIQRSEEQRRALSEEAVKSASWIPVLRLAEDDVSHGTASTDAAALPVWDAHRSSSKHIAALNTLIDYDNDDTYGEDLCSYWAPASSSQVVTNLLDDWTVADHPESSPSSSAQSDYKRWKKQANKLSAKVLLTDDPAKKGELMLQVEAALRCEADRGFSENLER